MRVFGKPQAYRIDFTPISQPWLRELAKQWAREHAPLAHAGSTRRAVASIGELSRSLRRREDRGLTRRRSAATTSRCSWRGSRARTAPGRLSAHKRSVLIADVSYFLRQARDLELGSRGPAGVRAARLVHALARGGAPRRTAPGAAARPSPARRRRRPAARPRTRSGCSKTMHGEQVRIAVELLADTGRRPNEICILAWDCLDHDAQLDENGQERKLAVLVHDMPKVARTGCRLPIDEQTAQLVGHSEEADARALPRHPGRRAASVPAAASQPARKPADGPGRPGADDAPLGRRAAGAARPRRRAV